MSPTKVSPVYKRIREILESARVNVARSVNTAQVMAYWLIGREIVEEQQRGQRRAGYGARLLIDLSSRLQADFGKGFSVNNLEHFRDFYVTYPDLIGQGKSHALRVKLAEPTVIDDSKISHAVRGKSDAVRRKSSQTETTTIGHAVRDEFWTPSRLHPNLSWTHYRTLLRVDKPQARAFYEIEALRNNWSARELERQKNSLLYERLALSKDKKGLMKLATRGHEVQRPVDVFKDPVVIEFLDLPESPRLVETDLEQALINNLQSFLLELGKGFAYVARQERLTLDGDHFYIDLVFYHTVLKCYVIIDLKTGKLTHQDLGQLQLYVNYYAVVKYTVGPAQEKKLFASRYKLHLPTEAELKAEVRRELREWRRGDDKV